MRERYLTVWWGAGCGRYSPCRGVAAAVVIKVGVWCRVVRVVSCYYRRGPSAGRKKGGGFASSMRYGETAITVDEVR